MKTVMWFSDYVVAVSWKMHGNSIVAAAAILHCHSPSLVYTHNVTNVFGIRTVATITNKIYFTQPHKDIILNREHNTLSQHVITTRVIRYKWTG